STSQQEDVLPAPPSPVARQTGERRARFCKERFLRRPGWCPRVDRDETSLVLYFRWTIRPALHRTTAYDEERRAYCARNDRVVHSRPRFYQIGRASCRERV